MGEPTTPRLARGRKDGSTKIDTILGRNPHGEPQIIQQGTSIVQTKADLRMLPYPCAKGTRKGTFQEPVSPYGAIYAYNHVHVSESGHVIEIDDTPTRERLHWWHRSGTYREIGPLGTMVDKSNRDYYSCVLKNTHETVGGFKYSAVKYGYELAVNFENNLEKVRMDEILQEKITKWNNEHGISEFNYEDDLPKTQTWATVKDKLYTNTSEDKISELEKEIERLKSKLGEDE